MSDIFLTRAERLAEIQHLTVEIYVQLLSWHLECRADSVLFAGLVFASYLSLMPLDDSIRTSEQDRTLASLALSLQDALDAAQRDLPGNNMLPRVSDVVS